LEGLGNIFNIAMELSSEEKKQYDRHLILSEIGNKGQEKLKLAKVLLIGAGGLGCPVLQYLTAAGIGTIGIIDDDLVSVSNLQRQILFTYEDVGKPKVDCAIERLSKINPFISFEGFVEKLTKNNAIQLFKRYDVIVDGSDNFPTRYLVNDAAVIAKKPIVFGSIFKFEGQVSVFNFENGPTYRCLYPEPPKDGEVPNCSEIGVLGVLPGIVGCFQANETIKIVCGLGEVLTGKLLMINTLNLQQQIIRFLRNENIDITELASDYESFCGIPSKINEIEYSEITQIPEKYFLLDVRKVSERKDFNLGGKHIPISELQNRISEIDTSKTIVVYCASGIRSRKAVTTLIRHFGDDKVLSLKGGTNAIDH